MALRTEVAAGDSVSEHRHGEASAELRHVLRRLKVEGLVRLGVRALDDRADVDFVVDQMEFAHAHETRSCRRIPSMRLGLYAYQSTGPI